MERIINNSNRLPGAEKLTRPEDIKGLSRFLKKVKSDNLELTESVMKDTPGLLDIIPGVNTGKIPDAEVKDAYHKNTEYIDRAPGRMGELPRQLSEDYLKAPGRMGTGLESKIFSSGPRVPGKSPVISKLPGDNRGQRGSIESQEVEISEFRDKLDIPEADLNIESTGSVSLPGTETGDNSLSTTRKDISDNQDNSLSTTRKDISDNQDNSLSTTRKDISDNQNNSLSTARKDLSVNLDNSLSTTRKDLVVNQDNTLSNTREDLVVNQDNTLSNTRKDLSVNQDNSLSTVREDLSVNSDNALSTVREDISVDLDNTLSSTRKDLSVDLDNTLSTVRKDLSTGPAPELPVGTVNLEDPTEISLSDVIVQRSGSDLELELPDKLITNDHPLPEVSLGEKIYPRNKVNSETIGKLSGNLKKLLDIAKSSQGGYWKLNNIPETALEDERIGLEVPGVTDLRKKKITEGPVPEVDLPDIRKDLVDTRDTVLPGLKKELPEELPETSLGNKRLGFTDPRETKLGDKLESVPGEKPSSPLPDFVLTPPDALIDDPVLPDFALIAPGELQDISPGKDKANLPGELSDPELGREKATLTDDTEDKLETKLVSRPVHSGPGKKEKLDNLLNSEEAISGLLKNPDYTDVFNKLVSALRSDTEFKDLSDKVASFLSSRLDPGRVISPGSKEKILEERLKALSLVSTKYFEPSGGDVVGRGSNRQFVPDYKIEMRDPLAYSDPSVYMRLLAEKAGGIFSKKGGSWSKWKEKVVKETLLMLLDARALLRKNITKTDPNTLPYNQGNNRPTIDLGGNVISKLEVGNSREDFDTFPGKRSSIASLLLDKVAGIKTDPDPKKKPFDLKQRYFSSRSFKQTLRELCFTDESPSQLEDLKSIIESSPYMSSPTKFGTIRRGEYGSSTLDTNNNWEVIFEPFTDKIMNGDFSFLPDIREMNLENLEAHGVRTGYGNYMPFNSFELQKSKIITKPLELYEGEVNYPVGVEMTNELRFTIVDDSLKTWRRYFEKCMEVSVYSSQPHRGEYYLASNPEESFTPTVIDKSNLCIAMYKNVTFRIRLYVLNPQLNTIRKFDLLCVLKDFSEDYSGEVDSSGNELSVSFSIVGENPELASKRSETDRKNALGVAVKRKRVQNKGAALEAAAKAAKVAKALTQVSKIISTGRSMIKLFS